jgi:hypothetical protein
MSKSPAPGELMGIGKMLNTKGGPVGLPGINPEQLPVPGFIVKSERAESPHMSEHSRHSTPLNHLNNGVSYPSPAAMQAQMHVSQANMTPPGMSLPGLPPHMTASMVHEPFPTGTDAAQQAPKAYHCSDCGKGFARRSDLARHGEFLGAVSYARAVLLTFCCRADPLGTSAARVRVSQLRKEIYSTICPHGPPKGAYWGETAHV